MELIWVKKNHGKTIWKDIFADLQFAWLQFEPFGSSLFRSQFGCHQDQPLRGSGKRPVIFFFIIKVTYFWLTKITGGFILRTFSMILIYFHRIFKKVWVSSSNFPGPGDDFFQRTVSDCTATGSTGFAESIHCTEHGTESGAETYLPWNSVYVFQDTGILDFILDFYEILIFNDIYIKTSSRGVIL